MRHWLTIGVVLAIPARAVAWNKAGHMVSAAIAYEVLKQDSPATIPRVIDLLKQQRKYETQWAERLKVIPNLTDDEKDLYLFMLAARWADDIRDDSEYHHGPWHYINVP